MSVLFNCCQGHFPTDKTQTFLKILLQKLTQATAKYVSRKLHV